MRHPLFRRMTPRPIMAGALMLLAAPALSGCVSLGGGDPPDALLTVTAATPPTASDTAMHGTIGSALIVQMPSAPQVLRTTRVPVQTGATAVAYVQDAQWVEAPARLFQRLLADTISSRGRRLVLNESENITGPGEVLTGELTAFGVDADHMEVVVAYNALRLQDGGATVLQRRFEAREPISAVAAQPVGAAINRAANRVAASVADWAQ